MEQRLLVGGFAEFRQENLDEYLDGVDPAWERCVNRCKKKTYFLQNCSNIAFVFQVWCTWPVSASTTRATWRRWCCWWWRTNWAGLKCAALDNKIKLHQFSQWLQIDDEEDMFATNPEEMPKRWRTKLFVFFQNSICWQIQLFVVAHFTLFYSSPPKLFDVVLEQQENKTSLEKLIEFRSPAKYRYLL